MTVRVIRSCAEFVEIRDAWMRLRAETPGASPCLHWSWIDCFWKQMLPPHVDAAVITVWRGDRLVGAAPIVVAPSPLGGLGLPALAGMENAHTQAYEWLLSADPLTARETAGEIAGALSAIVAKRALVTWRNAPEHSPATSAAREALAAAGWRVIWRPQRPHRVIHFPDGADQFVASFSRNMRSRLRKSSRTLEEQGTISFEEVSESADLHDRLDRAWELESRGWKGQAGTAVMQNEMLRKFYDSLALRLVPEHRFALLELRCKDKLISFVYALREADRLYGLKLGYDTDLARGSPGHAVLLHAVQWASARGMTSLDLGPDSDFKAYWGGTLEPMGSVHAFPHGLFGTAAVMQLTGKALIRRVRTRFSRSTEERRH